MFSAPIMGDAAPGMTGVVTGGASPIAYDTNRGPDQSSHLEG